jgi:heme A synthase
MGGDFPRWFVIGFLGLLPLQAWLGWWLAWGRRRGKMP